MGKKLREKNKADHQLYKDAIATREDSSTSCQGGPAVSLDTTRTRFCAQRFALELQTGSSVDRRVHVQNRYVNTNLLCCEELSCKQNDLSLGIVWPQRQRSTTTSTSYATFILPVMQFQFQLDFAPEQ